MADGVGLVGAHGVGHAGVLAVERLALQPGQVAARRLERLRKLLGRAARRLAAEHGLAAGGGGAGVGGDGGVGALMEDARGRDARHLMHELRAHRSHALAHARRAGADAHHAAFHGQAAAADVRQAHAYAAVFHGPGDARVGAAFKRFPHGLQTFDVARIRRGDLPVGQHLSGADGVAVADLPRGDAHLLGQQVQVDLAREAALRDAEAAEGAAGHVVGIDADAGDVHVLEVVGTAGMRAGALQNRPAQGGVGPAVGDEQRLHGQEFAVLVAGGGHVHLHGVALGVDVEALLPGELHLHGPARGPGHQRRVMLHAHVLLAAEAAAHQLGLAAHLFRRQLEHAADFLLLVVDRLAGGVHQKPAVAVRDADGAFRLHEGMVGHRGGIVPGDHVRRLRDRLVHVAPAQHLLGEDVAVFVQPGRVLLHGLARIGEGRELGVGHVHQAEHLVQRLLVIGGHQHDRVAHVARAVALGDQHVPVLNDMPGLVEGHVLGGKDPDHVGMRQRAGQVDLLHPRARVFGAQGLGVDHAGKRDVIHEKPGAQHLFRHVHPRKQVADARVRVAVRHGQVFAQHPGRQQNGLLDAHIARAAADVAPDGLFDILGRGVGVLGDQRLGAQHHAGDAKAALHRARLPEGVDVHLALALGESLHGGDVLSVQLGNPEYAGLGLLAVHQDGARAARALAAAVFHAGQPQVVPQVIQQLAVLFSAAYRTVHIQSVHASLLIALHTVRRLRPRVHRPLPPVARPHRRPGRVPPPQSLRRAYNPRSDAAPRRE